MPEALRPGSGEIDDSGYYRLSPWELATGWLGGFDVAPRPEDAPGVSARAAFERALIPALERSPCVVAFSGGRDSSAILAVAMHVARREGLPEPIAATHDFKGIEWVDESSYQELVIRQAGVTDWHRFRDVDAFDVLGEHARNGLRTHGLLWPALAHCHAPLVELAGAGGSLVIGEGGDELLGPQRMNYLNYLLLERPRPTREMLESLLQIIGPAPLRRFIVARESAANAMHPWLGVAAQEAFRRQMTMDVSGAPLRWDTAVLRHLGRRAVTMSMHNIGRVLADSGVTLHTPFLDPGFAQAFAASGGRRGFISRTGMMRMLFSDVVPDEICHRDEKARFGAVAVGRESRAFLADWDGAGVDTEVVDVERFRRACLAEMPLFGTQMLLQAAWLASEGAADPRPSEVSA